MLKPHAAHHRNELTGLKGALATVESGLKLYGTLKGAWDVGRAVYQGARMVAPVVAGLL